MRVLVSGTTGLNKREYLQEVVVLCHADGKQVKVFRFEDVLREFDPTGTFRPENLYQFDAGFLQLLFQYGFNELVALVELAEKDNDIVVVEMHVSYIWDQVQSAMLTPHQIANGLRPDVCVTLIDDVQEVYARVASRKDTASQRLLSRGNPLSTLLYWRTNEIDMTRLIARDSSRFDEQRQMHLPGDFLVARVLGPKFLADLLTRSRFAQTENPTRIVYASFSISHLKGDEPYKVEARKQVDDFRDFLKKHFIVIDPYGVSEKKFTDLIDKQEGENIRFTSRDGVAFELPREIVSGVREQVDGQIVKRDDVLVRSADALIQFLAVHPTEGFAYPSDGAAYERTVAWQSGKDVVMITEASAKTRGPFSDVATVNLQSIEEAVLWFKKQGWLKS